MTRGRLVGTALWRFSHSFNLSSQGIEWKVRLKITWRFFPDILREEVADLEDGFWLYPFAKPLLTETAQKMKVNKIAAVKFLIVLSFLTILQTMTVQYNLKKRNVKGEKIIVQQCRGRSVIFVHRYGCQKPASGKGQNVFDEGKTFYGIKL